MAGIKELWIDIRGLCPVKRVWVCLLATLAFGLASQHVEATTLEEIKERGYLIAATEDNYPPFEFIEAGEPKGLDHDLYALLKEHAPFEVRQEIIPWQGLLTGVITGQYDLALSAGIISEQRAEQLDFLMPIAEATHYYITRKNDDSINSLADLSGRPFGVQQGSSIHQRLPDVDELLREHGGSLGTEHLYASYSEAFQDLAIGRIDYVMHSIVAAMDLVQKRPDDFEIGEAVVPVGYHAWAVRRGNEELRDYLNDFLQEVRRSGKLYELQEKWIGQSFPELPWEARLPGGLPIHR